MSQVEWTKEMTEHLLSLAETANSNAQIAVLMNEKFGTNLSRNSIIGRLYRINDNIETNRRAATFKNLCVMKALAMSKSDFTDPYFGFGESDFWEDSAKFHKQVCDMLPEYNIPPIWDNTEAGIKKRREEKK